MVQQAIIYGMAACSIILHELMWLFTHAFVFICVCFFFFVGTIEVVLYLKE